MARTKLLYQLLEFALHVPKFLSQLIILKCETDNLLFALSVSNLCLFLFVLVKLNSCLKLCCLAFKSHVCFVHLINLLHVPLGLLFKFSNQTFDLALILVDLRFERCFLGCNFFDLCAVAKYYRFFVLKLNLKRFSFSLKSLVQILVIVFKSINLYRVKCLLSRVVSILCLERHKLLFVPFVLCDRHLQSFPLGCECGK